MGIAEILFDIVLAACGVEGRALRSQIERKRGAPFLRASRFPVLCVVVVLLAGSLPLSQSAVQKPRVLGIAHVAFRVSDLDRTGLFYDSLLGYQEPFSLNDGTGKTTIAFVKMNDSQYLELFQGNAQTQGQLDHFALYTDDLAAMRAYLQSLGMYIAKDTHKGRIGNPFLTIRDPDGHFVEILQYSSTSSTGQSQGKFMPASRISDHIAHVGIVVSSVNLAMKFYRDALGLEEFARGAEANGRPEWIALRAPDGSDYIELIPQSTNPPSTDAKAQNHLGLASSDIRKTVAVLQERTPNSSKNSSLAIQTGDGLPARVNLVDPDGARIEIMEPLPPMKLHTTSSADRR